MGLIDFVKSAGAKLFGGGAEAPAAKSPEQLERERAAALYKSVSGMGFKVEELSVRIAGDTATVSGKAADQATREKIVLAVGNTAGIARVDDRMEVAAAEPPAVYYTVVRGDTLSKIAKQHYGDAMKYPVIFEANRPMLEHPDRIYPGQVLRIPPLAG